MSARNALDYLGTQDSMIGRKYAIMNKTTQFKGLLHSGHVEFNNFPMRRVYFLPTVLVLMVGMLLIVTPYAEPQDALIQVIDATTFGSSDPSGLTVLPDLPDSSTLFLSDSEIEETGFFMGVNLFELDVDGSLIFETNTLAFSNEPTGVAFNTSTNTLFITDDDKKKVFEIDLSFPDTVLSSFSTADFGSSDPEGITFDPVTGNLFIIDGRDENIYEVTTAGVLVESITLPSTIIDPEGIYYDYNNNVFFIVSGKNRDIFEVSRGGTIVNTIDVLQTYDVTLKGVTCGPSSDPAAPAGICHLWVADYGRDEVNDGRLFEIELGSNRPPMVDAGPNQTISFGTQATLAGIVIDDGQPSGTLDIQDCARHGWG